MFSRKMAGPLAVAAPEHHRENAAVSDSSSSSSQWLIEFARFFLYPSASSAHPPFVPFSEKYRRRLSRGIWLSSSSSTVSLRILADASIYGAILAVELDGKVLEEHYISKLNFSWPQMTCDAGFPPRGSRAIFVSYEDSTNQIQKFALRFSTYDAVDTFVSALKEKLKDLGEIGTQKSDNKSEISFQSDHMSSNKIVSRESTEDPEIVIPIDSYTPEMPPRSEYEGQQQSFSQQVGFSLIPDESSSALPPSFTTLLSECFSQANQDAGLTTVNEDADLKLQIMRYMEDSSFQDMLLRVEKVIDEIGGNWIL